MKVTIAVGGKWCAFEQAEQLARLGALDRIISSYPRFRLPPYKLEPEQLVSLPFPEMMYWATRRLPLPGFVVGNGRPDYWKAVMFDHLVSRRLRPCDIFIGWAVFAKKSIKVARSLGAVTCVERGSAHIATQEDLLRDEYQRWGLPWRPLHKGLTERHLVEYEEADYIIVQSTFAHQSFVARGVPPAKLLKIPLGIDLSLFHTAEKRDSAFRVVYVGAITIQKGVLHLLEGFRKAGLPNSELLLVGGLHPEVKPFLARWEGQFRLVGQVPHRTLTEWYTQASVFVLPSIQDGFAQVVLEAMACGLPAIASANSCGPDVIREGIDGYVVPPGDSDAIAEKLTLLYQRQDRLAEMRQAARQRAEEFSWERYGERAVRTFHDILARAKG
ncbi:MAG: glycosyltransferase family 4 protein [Chloroflexi bacterium]|nr:glycosyltransferase family 4 protein [Chloroflexota bacterium]